MPIHLYSLLIPFASLLGALFVVMVIVRDRESAPISWPMAVVCGLFIALIASGIHNDEAAGPYGWAAAIALCLGFLGWGAWDQRSYLFAVEGPAQGHVAATGQSLAGNLLIAATEELLFRGLMQSSAMGFFEGPGGPVMALFSVNLAFALMHQQRGMTFALSAGFFGLIMSMSVLLSGSVWPAVLTHMAWNLMVGIARRRATV
ncbi:MAG TPA: CPBP family intramembrane glutamic endopeptidase [Sphingomicrobium sp.]|nr:CPBP family intramembrane glutamic endopeptidase [Sphingomicrobium sp.]